MAALSVTTGRRPVSFLPLYYSEDAANQCLRRSRNMMAPSGSDNESSHGPANPGLNTLALSNWKLIGMNLMSPLVQFKVSCVTPRRMNSTHSHLRRGMGVRMQRTSA